jgi:L-cysteine S-thiosulfotransferase
VVALGAFELVGPFTVLELVVTLAALGLLMGCAGGDGNRPPPGPPPWSSRAILEARGEFKTDSDGKRVALRYRGWTTTDFGPFPTYAYADTRLAPSVTRAVMPAGLRADPARGRKLFLSRSLGPCTGCHLVPGEDVWPAGNVGPDLSTIGDRALPDDYVYMIVSDARVVYPETSMPPWGTTGALKPEQIVDIVAYLQSLRGPVPQESNPDRDPNRRPKPVGYGDNLDPTNNPAVLRAEGAETLWTTKGAAGKACAECHTGGPSRAMAGVATRYPKYIAKYGRVMAIEDLLTVHGPETTGMAFLAESAQNLDMTMLVKMASNGLPVQIDVESARSRAAWERGRASFFRRVGQRNHACADCHTADKGANKFLGGRLLGNVEDGLTRHFPTWRTSQSDVWDLRKRFQWCMTPLGTNMLAADAVEYAELELYLTSFDNGKPMGVPGIRH